MKIMRYVENQFSSSKYNINHDFAIMVVTVLHHKFLIGK